MSNDIKGFFGEYRFLSNFHPAPTEFEGILYPTSENAYQAAKTTDPVARGRYVDMTAGGAKKAGRRIQLRPDWEDIKLNVMETILYDKFTRNPDLREKLLATGDVLLEETNDWGDKFWGVCAKTGVGENMLGCLLMALRDQLAGSPTDHVVLVTGGRDYANRDLVYWALDEIHANEPIALLRHGGARGADSLADDWAKERGVPTEVMYPDWDRFGKRAGILRNVAMLDAGNIRGLISFPGGRGTEHMTEETRKRGHRVWKIEEPPQW